ncbi:MAG: SDR family NAD(P)-dependent oxidoreductase, partial [Pseudomonadota bacterium]
MDVAVIGASGGIGRALTDALVQRSEVGTVYALSRSGEVPEGPKIHAVRIDITDEASVQAAARAVSGELDLIIVATGILSDGADLQPEKSWRNISMNNLERVFRLNTFGPGLVAKHFLPLLARKRRAVFAALSARVGSISDNDLGGWHAYRASKSALNMLIRNFAL